MEKYSSICILKIDSEDYIIIKKSSECRFYADDVLVEIMSNKRFLICEDSFEFCAYLELTNSIERIINAKVGESVESIGAPCSRGGLRLIFKKDTNEYVILEVLTTRDKIIYSKKTNVQNLIKWKNTLDEVYMNRENIFFGVN